MMILESFETIRNIKENTVSYNGIHLENSISIDKIFSIHYFEYMNTFSFEGESHDFWNLSVSIKEKWALRQVLST